MTVTCQSHLALKVQNRKVSEVRFLKTIKQRLVCVQRRYFQE